MICQAGSGVNLPNCRAKMRGIYLSLTVGLCPVSPLSLYLTDLIRQRHLLIIILDYRDILKDLLFLLLKMNGMGVI